MAYILNYLIFSHLLVYDTVIKSYYLINQIYLGEDSG